VNDLAFEKVNLRSFAACFFEMQHDRAGDKAFNLGQVDHLQVVQGAAQTAARPVPRSDQSLDRGAKLRQIEWFLDELDCRSGPARRPQFAGGSGAPSAGPEHWLVSSWTPYGVSQAQMELDAAARGDNVVPSRGRHLSAAWLLVPLALLLLTIVTPAAVLAVSAVQNRRAERLYRTSLPSPAESEASSSSNPS